MTKITQQTAIINSIFALLFVFLFQNNFAQSTVAPNISYVNVPLTYTTGVAITAVTPTNSGGTSAANYAATPTITTVFSDPLSFPAGLAIDGAGNLYFTDFVNVATSVKKVATNGTVTNLGSGLNQANGLAIDSSGNLYVADTNNNAIKKITPIGITTAVGTSYGNTFNRPLGVAVYYDGQGRTALWVADTGNNRVKSILYNDAITTLVGYNSPRTVACSTDGYKAYISEASSGEIKRILNLSTQNTYVNQFSTIVGPYGMAIDPTGDVFVADTGNNVLKRIAANGTVSTIASGFNSPNGVTTDLAGNIFVADLFNNAIKKITVPKFSITPALPAGLTFNILTGVISGTPTAASAATTYTIATQNNCGSSSTTVTFATCSSLTSPTFTQVAPICSGATLAALPTTSTNGITGTWLPTINNLATTTYTFTPTAGLCATTATMTITVNSVTPIFTQAAPICSGNTLLALPTTSNNGISGTWAPSLNNLATTTYTFTPANSLCAITTTMTIIVNVSPNISYTNSASTYQTGVAISTLIPTNSGGLQQRDFSLPPVITTLATGLNGPRGIAIDNLKNVFAAETNRTVLKKIDINGFISTLGTGFNDATGLAVDPLGNVIVADLFNNAIKKVAINGTTTTIGTNITEPRGVAFDANNSIVFTDAYGLKRLTNGVTSSIAALGNFPYGVAADALGNFFVVESDSGLVKKITATGTISTVITGLYGPKGIASDAVGNVYVCDTFNNMVKRVATNGTITVLGSGFDRPWAIAIDTDDTIYVADSGNVAIKKMSFPSYTISPTLPSGLLMNTDTGQISGTPTAATSAIPYTISTFNSCGINNFTITFETCASYLSPSFTQIAPICSGSTLASLPTISSNGITGNWSPPLNNTQTTTYTFTPNTGQCATTAEMTIIVNQPAVPTFTQVAPICINSPLAALPTTSLNGISGTWSPALNNSATTTYTFSPTAGACATTATMTIVVKTVQGDPSVFGVGQWNVYAWNSGGAGATAGSWNFNYSGFYSVSGLNFDSRQQWDVLGSPSDATNYQGCPVAVDNHSWSAKRQGFPVKYYKINIDNHDDQADLLVNGILVWQHVGCCDAHLNAWQGNLGLNDTVEFRVTDGGSASLGAISFEEYFPRPTITANGTTSICAGSNVVLTSSSADSYLWSTGQTTQSITVSTAGNYTVQATIGAQNNASVATVVIVNPIITPTFTQISPICSGASLAALATRSNNGIDGTWSPVINNVATTTYLFTPVASACANAVTLTIIVNPQPPQPVIACYQTANFNTITCAWVVSGNQPVQPNLACYQTANFNTSTCAWVISGNQPVQPTLACYQTANFDTTTCAWVISGVQPQNPIISFNGNVLTSNIIGTSYQWFILNNSGVFVPIVGANSLNYTAVENGSYRVEVVAANCTLTSNTFTSTTLFNESFEKEGVSFYPNPFETIFNIVINENAEATITDVFGKQIAFQNLISGTNTIDLSGRAAGVYFVKIRPTKGNKTIKMIKK